MHFHIGPALGRIRLPLGPAVVSAILHVVLLAIVVFSASMWSDKRTKPVYVVLAPATAAIGSPKGVTMPPRVEEPPAPQAAPQPAPHWPRQFVHGCSLSDCRQLPDAFGTHVCELRLQLALPS